VATLTRGGNANDPSNLIVYTLSSLSYGGAAGADRTVVALIAIDNDTLQSVTIGGVAATVERVQGDGSRQAAVAYAAVPSGSSGTVVITCNGTTSGVSCELWSLNGVTAPWAPSNSNAAINSGTSFNITDYAGGIVLGICCKGTTSGSLTWSNLTGYLDIPFNSNNRHGTAAAQPSSAGTRSVSCSGSGSDFATVAASWEVPPTVAAKFHHYRQRRI